MDPLIDSMDLLIDFIESLVDSLYRFHGSQYIALLKITWIPLWISWKNTESPCAFNGIPAETQYIHRQVTPHDQPLYIFYFKIPKIVNFEEDAHRKILEIHLINS